MNKEVSINIKSVQKTDDESDTTELFTVGTFERKTDCDFGYILKYDESEATGFEGSSVTLDIGRDMVTMLRTGSSVSNLIIEKGKKHHCHYGTPFGEFMVGINADKIDVSLGDDGGDLFLKYTIDINSGFMSENEMTINIKEN